VLQVKQPDPLKQSMLARANRCSRELELMLSEEQPRPNRIASRTWPSVNRRQVCIRPGAPVYLQRSQLSPAPATRTPAAEPQCTGDDGT
jgi:hypothetical protein